MVALPVPELVVVLNAPPFLVFVNILVEMFSLADLLVVVDQSSSSVLDPVLWAVGVPNTLYIRHANLSFNALGVVALTTQLITVEVIVNLFAEAVTAANLITVPVEDVLSNNFVRIIVRLDSMTILKIFIIMLLQIRFKI